MQKKLLSFLLLTQYSVALFGGEEMRQKNMQQFNILRNEINDLEEQLAKKKQEKDEIDAALYHQDQEAAYREKLVEELSLNGQVDAINAYKKGSDNNSQNLSDKLKKNDNGIERAWLFGVTDPIKGSRSAKEYARIAHLKEKRNKIDSELLAKMNDYKDTVVNEILPPLKNDVNNKISVIQVSYLPAFQKCDCYTETAYFQCLAKKGINKKQVSEQFVDTFTDEGLVDAFEQITKRNIPLTQEEFIAIANAHPVTKDTMIRFALIRNDLKKAIRRELFKPAQKEEEKTSILENAQNIEEDKSSSQ